MTTVSTKSGRIIKVVSKDEEKSTLTKSDTEMDERAVEAVKAAINKAKICKKPIAGYDKEKKQAYNDYMKLPPEETRNIGHSVLDIILDKPYDWYFEDDNE